MTQSFEAETHDISLRNDLNLIYTLSSLIKTLTKIDSKDSQDIALLSANAILRTASALLVHVQSLYEARDPSKAREGDTAKEQVNHIQQ